MRVVGNIMFRPRIEVGEVAATAAGNQNFFANSIVVLQYRYGATALAGGHRA